MTNEIHGLAKLTKIAMADANDESVIITDCGDNRIALRLSTSSYGAVLTPDQARWIAKQLMDSATRVETEIPE